ncbi:hypothetical protein SK128_020458 [Halocaridina rubra]|uniref:Uncharacterized protein n=1 Tax=Halocaridina rubra TaxID=373956 RepID=A0AAN8WXM8_HALRR
MTPTTINIMSKVNFTGSDPLSLQVRGFYKGMGFPLLATGTLNSLFFGVYGNCVRKLAEGKPAGPAYSDIFLAGCAGGLAQLSIACPIDLVKIKMQMQTGVDQGIWGKHYESRYKGPATCLKDLYRRGGISGCYIGFSSMLIRDVPTFGFYMVLYHFFTGIFSDGRGSAGAYCQVMSGGLAVTESQHISNHRSPVYPNA